MEELMDRSAKYIAIEEVEASKATTVTKKDRAEHKRKFSPEERSREDRKRRDRRDRYRRPFQPKFELYSSLNRTPARIMEDVYGRTGDQDGNRRVHPDRDRRREEPPRENPPRNIAGTIKVIARGITRGTEATPQSRKKQARSIMKLEYQSKKPRTSHPKITFSNEDYGSAGRKGSGVGVTILTPEGVAIDQALELNLKTTNNQAEYEALIAGLNLASELGATNLLVSSDSQLVVGQLSGDFEVKEPTIAKYVER
ncbi:Ribonuclease H [Senna tora]|uniref:Ribonuclease H n=1 Tax=Senna tora TaxID=362788 RepID=A0A834SQQ0_9FABA|nr:Ribonuclease H [Senna tora]